MRLSYVHSHTKMSVANISIERKYSMPTEGQQDGSSTDACARAMHGNTLRRSKTDEHCLGYRGTVIPVHAHTSTRGMQAHPPYISSGTSMRIVRLFIRLICSLFNVRGSEPCNVPGSEKKGTSKVTPHEGQSEEVPHISVVASIS